MSGEPKFCGHCGKKLHLKENETNCPECGISIQTNNTHTSEKPIIQYVSHKSSSTAALLAFIGGIFGFCGIGHIYVGKVGRGILIMLLGIFLYGLAALTVFILLLPSPSGYSNSEGASIAVIVIIVAGILYFIVFILQIIDARRLAKKFNRKSKTTGIEPW